MDLTPVELVLFVLLASFGLVGIFAAISRLRHARDEARACAEVVVCRLCLHAFEDLRDEKIVNCPVCGALNEKQRRRDPA